VMVSYRLFGVSDAAARLVPALAAVLLVLLTYAWARSTTDAWTALLAALVLCLSARFVYLGRMLVIDGVLAVWVVAALAAAHRALVGWCWRWWLLSAVCCGLGLLTKGPVALALVLPPMMAGQLFLRLRRSVDGGRWTVDGGRWTEKTMALPPSTVHRPPSTIHATPQAAVKIVVYVAVALAVAAPWYTAVALLRPAAAADFIWQHNVQRFIAPFDHVKPFWFYLPLLLTGSLPWSLLLLPLARRLLAPPRADAAPLPAAWYFWLTACGWCLLFFSLSGCKRATYLLPVLPLLALVLGAYLGLLIRPGNRRGLVKLWGCTAVTFAVLLAGVQDWLPEYHRQFGLRGQVRRHRALARDGSLAVYCYPHRWDSVSFYLERDDVLVFGAGELAALAADLAKQPRALVFLKSARGLAELQALLPPTHELVAHGRQGGRVAVGLVRPRLTAP